MPFLEKSVQKTRCPFWNKASKKIRCAFWNKASKKQDALFGIKRPKSIQKASKKIRCVCKGSDTCIGYGFTKCRCVSSCYRVRALASPRRGVGTECPHLRVPMPLSTPPVPPPSCFAPSPSSESCRSDPVHPS